MDDGKSIDEILGSDCEEPIFMVDPLVLKFCLWFLTREFFFSPRIVYDKLVTYAAQRIDFHVIDTDISSNEHRRNRMGPGQFKAGISQAGFREM